MEKSTSNYPSNNMPQHSGATISTASGVTILDSNSMNYNAPPPPSYDQAMGNPAPSAKTECTYTTTNGWSAPGIGAQNTGYGMPPTHSTTGYSTYEISRPQPSGNQQTHQTFVQPPVVIIQQQPFFTLGPEPLYVTCPACRVQKLTRIEYEPSSRTHLMAALLCLVGLWCCVCLPYCAGSCMNTHHYCGNCDKFLGTYGNGV